MKSPAEEEEVVVSALPFLELAVMGLRETAWSAMCGEWVRLGEEEWKPAWERGRGFAGL